MRKLRKNPSQPATGHSDVSAEPVDFLQRRVGQFGVLALMLASIFWMLKLVLYSMAGRVTALIEPGHIFHTLAILVFVAQALLCRGKPRSRAFVHAVDICGLVLASIFFEAMGQYLRMAQPELIVGIALTHGLVGRAVFVPSTPRRTLALAVLVGIPYVALTFFPNAELPGDHTILPGGVFGEAATRAGVWGMATLLSIATSHVIYGLRKEASQARQLGQYTLEQKLGEGGMGAVYRARHAMLRRPTAVKLLPPDKAGEKSVARFEREVQLTARLTHPNTVTIFDYGRTPDGTFYYAMELIDGAALDVVVDLSGPQSPARVLHILDQVSSALSEAHGIGLIHRDIKPANVMLCKQGGVLDVAKVVDFGLVKETSAQSVALTLAEAVTGTPLYMSPEAIRQPDTVDARSDLYALGAVGYYLLTGQHVFLGATLVEVCSHHLHTPPVRPGERLGAPVPEDLEALILSCLAKDAADRPQSAAELQERIRSCADFGAWAPGEAARWWEIYGPNIENKKRGSETSATTLTVAVDSDRRSLVSDDTHSATHISKAS